MEIGHFYYIDDQYFKDFPDPYLMQNKEKVNGQLHDRPCFYAFQDSNTQDRKSTRLNSSHNA